MLQATALSAAWQRRLCFRRQAQTPPPVRGEAAVQRKLLFCLLSKKEAASLPWKRRHSQRLLPLPRRRASPRKRRTLSSRCRKTPGCTFREADQSSFVSLSLTVELRANA